MRKRQNKKLQIPNTKHQINSKHQTQSSKFPKLGPGAFRGRIVLTGPVGGLNLELIWCLVFGIWSLLVSTSSFAEMNPISAAEIPELLPPRVEIPPTFWEQHGWWVLAGGVLAAALGSTGIWLLLRPKPVASIPPEVQARLQLEPLRQQPEDGAILSRVSQVLRHYIATAFSLPPEELTTTEFCRVITAAEQVGPELSQSVGEFLQECDRRKFAPSPPPQPVQAVPRAFKLIEIAEGRRAQLQQDRNPKSEI